MGTIIGISGKIGSGKNYLAEKLMQEFAKAGYSTSEGSFATALRTELNRIIKTIKVDYLEGKTHEEIVSVIAEMYHMSNEQAHEIYSQLISDIIEIDGLSSYSRTESVRRALQFLGTDVRRAKEENYWVNAFHTSIPKDDFVLVTDVRFPNEADSIKQHDGIMVRLDLDTEVIKARIQSRDGLQYSEDALNHPSEKALDAYPNFDYVLNENFDAEKLASQIINSVDRFRRIAEQGV